MNKPLTFLKSFMGLFLVFRKGHMANLIQLASSFADEGWRGRGSKYQRDHDSHRDIGNQIREETQPAKKDNGER